MTAAELRALLAKATPGKWGWGDFDNCDLPFLPLNTAGSLDAYGPKNQHGESASTVVMWLGRDHGLKPKDAALIVALRNAAEEIAGMLEEREARVKITWAPTEEVICADSCTRYHTPRLIVKKKTVRRRVLTETGEVRVPMCGEWYGYGSDVVQCRTIRLGDSFQIYAESFVEVVPK